MEPQTLNPERLAKVAEGEKKEKAHDAALAVGDEAQKKAAEDQKKQLLLMEVEQAKLLAKVSTLQPH